MERNNPTSTALIGTDELMKPGPTARLTTVAYQESQQDPQPSAEAGHHAGFDEELHQDVATARAQRFADANLMRAFRDARQHDVHDDDASHHHEHRHDGDGDPKHGGGDLVPESP